MASTLQTVSDCCNACSGISVTVTTVAGTQNLFVYDSIAALRAGDAPATTVTNGYAIVKGIAQYYWQGNSTATDDSISIIKPSATDAANPGRWLQQI